MVDLSLCFLFQTFILQLEGKTKWKLFKPLQELPQEASPDLELGDLGEPTDEFDMEVHVHLLVLCDSDFYFEIDQSSPSSSLSSTSLNFINMSFWIIGAFMTER